MKIPKTINILGRRFTVLNNLTEDKIKELVGDGTTPFGAMNYSKKIILIRKHECKDEQFITFFHECLHVMQYVVGLNQVTNLDIAEVWCESGANAMIDVFKACK